LTEWSATALSGAEALEAAVDLFYQKNEKDDRINEMFENADIGGGGYTR
jgi:truncated hemoglobin YjbI